MGRKKEYTRCKNGTTTMTFVNTGEEVENLKIIVHDSDNDMREEDDDNTQSSHQCHLCQKTLKNKYALKTHMVTHEEKRFVCKECGMSFGTKGALERHNKCKHMDMELRPYPCDLCEMRFLNKSHLATHYKKHTGERDVKCGLCLNSFYSKADLVRHMKGKHLNIRSFICNVCQKGFFRKSYLKVHLLSVHMQPTDVPGTIQRYFSCRYCKKVFQSKTTCYAHERTHSDRYDASEQRALCGVCGKTFTRESSLKKHMEKHTGPPTHKCDICGRLFYHMSSYKRHLNIHNRSDPDICQVCGTLFTNRDAFRRHLRKHVTRGEMEAIQLERNDLPPRIAKVQDMIAKGLLTDMDIGIEVVELGSSKKENRSNRSSNELTDAERLKWTLNVDTINGSIYTFNEQYVIVKNEFGQEVKPIPSIFNIESPAFKHNMCYSIISNEFNSIVKNKVTILHRDDVRNCFNDRSFIDASKFSKECFIFDVIPDNSSVNNDHEDGSDRLSSYKVSTKYQQPMNVVLQKHRIAQLYPSINDEEIPSYIEQIPEILLDYNTDPTMEVYHFDCKEIDSTKVKDIHINLDIVKIQSLLEHNLFEILFPLKFLSRKSRIELKKAYEEYYTSTKSKLCHTALNVLDNRIRFNTYMDIKYLQFDAGKVSLVKHDIIKVGKVNRAPPILRIRTIDSLLEDVNHNDTTKPKKETEHNDSNGGSPCMDDYIYEEDVFDDNFNRSSYLEEYEEKPNIHENIDYDVKIMMEPIVEIVKEEDVNRESDEQKVKRKKKKKISKKKGKLKRKRKRSESRSRVAKTPVIKTITDEFICDYCEKQTSSKSTMRTHIATCHLPNKKCTCDTCGLSFIAKSRLESHVQNVHLRIRNYQCASCEWSFYAKADLDRHERRHTGVKPFMCHLCSKTFVRKAQLKAHIVIHSGERRFMCNMCGKSFTTRSTLCTHLKRHNTKESVRYYNTGGKKQAKKEPQDHICVACGKTLSTAHSLIRHIKGVHEKVRSGPDRPLVQKEHQCPSCPLSFTHKTSMQRHMHRIHKRYKEPRNYACPLCGRKLLNESSVLQHMIKRHPQNCDDIQAMNSVIAKATQRNVPCPLCKRKFLKESGLHKHMIKKHYYENPDVEYVTPQPPSPPSMYTLIPEEYKPNLLML